MGLLEQIDKNRLPKHVAIIMDGNGRWAKKKGLMRVFGHENGVQAVRQTCEAAAELGISYLTLYAFSTENWNRPQREVNALMSLLVKTIKAETPTLLKNNIRLEAIGDLSQLPKNCIQELNEAIDNTKHNSRTTLILALSYSSKWDIVNSVKKIAQMVKDGTLEVENIDENLITNALTTAPYPHPELLIRTSGEYRLSNFLLWELAYSEFYFTDVLWPDFRKEHLYQALTDYQNRERRFGKTSDQITAS
jgi:undecaprenyl diphosphate synthase